MLFNKIILLLFATLLLGDGYSQTINKEKLDQYINTLEVNDKLMATTLVLQNGKMVYARSAGFSNIGAQTMYVLLCNAENYSLDDVNNSILSVVFNKGFTLPVFTRFTVPAASFDQYRGTYTSETNPLVIEIWSKNNFLLAQPHGQQVYTMAPVDINKFLHEKTKVTLEFTPSENKMILHQGPQTIVFTRK